MSIKYRFLLVLFLVVFLESSGQSSQVDTHQKIVYYKTKIKQSDRNDKMQWIDSLVRAVWERPELQYDSISKVSIDFAFELDSLAKASRVLSDLMYYHNNVIQQPQNTIELYDLYYDKFEKFNDDFALGSLNLYVGDAYTFSNDYEKGTYHYKKAISYGEKSPKKILEGLATLYLGYSQSSRGEFSKASENYRRAAALFVNIQDTLNLINTKNALAILYSKNDFFEEAKTERFEAIEMAKQINYSSSLITMYYNAAMDFKKTWDFENQISYLKASIKENNSYKYGSHLKKILLTELSKAYANVDSLNLATSYFNELEEVLQSEYGDDYQNDRYYLDAKKTLSFVQKNYKDALEYGHKYVDIQRERNLYEELMRGEKFLSNVYASMGMRNKQNEHLVTYYKIRDSIASVKKIKSLSYYQTLYETEKRDHKIESQKANIDLLELKNKNKTQWFIFSCLGLILMFCMVLFYRSYRTAKVRQRDQQEFSQNLIKTQEEERTRIAKDLHDGIGQQLVMLKRKAQNLNQSTLTELAQNTLDEVRHISRDLYPVTLAKLGLTDSIEQLLIELDEETDMFVSVEIEDVNSNFNETESLNFYRFIQESLNNVIKHANAKTLIVNINKRKDGVKILIKDNGEGFHLNDEKIRKSLGLKTMAERISMLKGHFSIKSRIKGGTSILVQIPS